MVNSAKPPASAGAELQKQREYASLVRHINGLRPMKYCIRTFGCQMNENDSERLAGMLREMGYNEANAGDKCDIIVFNTCCVRENAELKVFGHLGALKKEKRDNPDMVIAVCGCMMQQENAVRQIKEKYGHVDIVFGTHNLHTFPELLYRAVSTGERTYDVWDIPGHVAEGVPIERKDRIKAWVTVMYGCNNFCSYCIVPYVRGRERSRNPETVIEEISSLGSRGIREVTLLGQNVNSYGRDIGYEKGFAGLLREVDKIEGIERIRFMTSHPKDLSDELIQAMADCPGVCEHLHLPIQSGSTRILREMNRNYTREHYMDLILKLRAKVPGISITTDIIAGFPGETEEDFEETLDLLERIRFDFAFTFIYSKRAGTPAAEKEGQVPAETVKDRFDRLVRVQNRISRQINDRLLGQEVEVLVEGTSSSNKRMYTGRTRTNKVVNFRGDESMVGKLVNVRVDNVQTWSLGGSVV